MVAIDSEQHLTHEAPAPEAGPPAGGRWLLFLVLAGSLVMVQILVVMLALFVFSASNQVTTQADVEAFISSEPGLLMGIIAAAIAGTTVVLVALVWPPIWNFLSGSKKFRAADWVSWRKPAHLRLWLVPVITFPLLLALGYGVGLIFGDSVVEVQMQLFSTPLLQVVSSITVVFIAPISEELVFRGALYNALLPSQRPDAPPWHRHILPYILTSLAFAGLHLIAGFDRIGSIVLITLFSLYLTALRSYTGSIKASFVAHLSWNTLAAVGLIAQQLLELGNTYS